MAFTRELVAVPAVKDVVQAECAAQIVTVFCLEGGRGVGVGIDGDVLDTVFTTKIGAFAERLSQGEGDTILALLIFSTVIKRITVEELSAQCQTLA